MTNNNKKQQLNKITRKNFSLIKNLLPLIYLPLIILLVFFTLTTNGFFIKTTTTPQQLNKQQRLGLLKLCPAGGESFATAWQIACGMRRRKRDVGFDENGN